MRLGVQWPGCLHVEQLHGVTSSASDLRSLYRDDTTLHVP